MTSDSPEYHRDRLKSLEISNQRLNNDKFVENAKQELIDQEKQNVQNLNSQIESINSTLKSLDN